MGQATNSYTGTTSGSLDTTTADALKKRKDYSVSSEVLSQYARDLNSIYASSELQQSIDNEADSGASRTASAINRSATSSTDALNGAVVAEQQRQLGYQKGSIAGNQQKNINKSNLSASTNALNQAKDQAYELNTQQPFEITLQHQYQIDNANRQQQIAQNNQQAQMFQSILGAALLAL